MKLVAISAVENQADVIEAFVRHTCTWVDKILIHDRQSTDGTRELLAALVREGLPLVLFGGALDGAVEEELKRRAAVDHGADWVFSLRADEFVVAKDRAALEQGLQGNVVSALVREYVATAEDDARETNPAVRVQHRRRAASSTPRPFAIRALALSGMSDGAVAPADVWLARFGFRSATQEAVRVIMGELEKLGKGSAHEGLDTHFRLGFQLLAEDPARFASTVLPARERLEYAPLPYRGGALRYSGGVTETFHVARTLLPFLERLAVQRGRLADGLVPDAATTQVAEPFAIIDTRDVRALRGNGEAAFDGFVPVSGWQAQDRPVAAAFLPAFHWTTAPETVVVIHASSTRRGRLEAEMLTYAERQVMTVLLNGGELTRHVFTRVNQKETLLLALKLEAGENRLVFRHRAWIDNAADPRKLAVAFLSLRVTQE